MKLEIELNAVINALNGRISKAEAKHSAKREEQRRILVTPNSNTAVNPSEAYDKLMEENMRLKRFISYAKNAVTALESLDENDIDI